MLTPARAAAAADRALPGVISGSSRSPPTRSATLDEIPLRAVNAEPTVAGEATGAPMRRQQPLRSWKRRDRRRAMTGVEPTICRPRRTARRGAGRSSAEAANRRCAATGCASASGSPSRVFALAYCRDHRPAGDASASWSRRPGNAGVDPNAAIATGRPDLVDRNGEMLADRHQDGLALRRAAQHHRPGRGGRG